MRQKKNNFISFPNCPPHTLNPHCGFNFLCSLLLFFFFLFGLFSSRVERFHVQIRGDRMNTFANVTGADRYQEQQQQPNNNIIGWCLRPPHAVRVHLFASFNQNIHRKIAYCCLGHSMPDIFFFILFFFVGFFFNFFFCSNYNQNR